MTHPAINTASHRDAALSYAARGWPVLPLHWWAGSACSCGDPGCISPAKHPYSPLVPNGLHNATTIAQVVESWWKREPRCNIGVRTGAESGLLVVDVDVRDDKDGRERMAALVVELGPLPETVEAITGSGSTHLLFQHPAHLTVGKLGGGVDVKSDGGYIVVAPSSHASGRTYEWSAFNHPDDVPLATLPAAWSQRLRFAAPPPTAAPTARPIDPDTTQRIRSALGVLDAWDHDEWIKIGMALHHESGGSDQGMGLWYEWSAAHAGAQPNTKKADLINVRRKWGEFGRTGRDPVTVGYLYQQAEARGWVPPRPTVVDLSRFAVAPASPATFPEELATHAPGVLAPIVQWSLAGAPAPVALYSLAGALCLASVVCGRHYALDGVTFSSLYVLVSGRSGSGKEWARKTVARLLVAANATHLLGPGDFSSEGAVLSALRDRPQLVALLDEFGHLMAASKGPSGHHRAGANKLFMEAWGACDGELLPKAMSTLSLRPNQAPPAPTIIYRPALTLMATTAPDRLHAGLEGAHVTDGFLNRWLLLEHVADVGTASPPRSVVVPPAVLAWIGAILAPRTALGAVGSGVVPHVTDVPTTDAVRQALQAAAVDATTRTNALNREQEGLGALWVRAAEMVGRLTLVAALARDAHTPIASAEDVAWAQRLVWWSTDRMVAMAMDKIGESPFAKARAKVLEAVRRAGAEGVSRRDLLRLCRDLDVRGLSALMDTLVSAEQVAVTTAPNGRITYFPTA
jgi:hypothetical protein